MSARRGLCLVIAGPSGCGKTTIMERLLADDPCMHRSISATTRSPRAGEVDGESYYFTTPDEFEFLAATGEMLEHAEVFGCRYGTPKAPVTEHLAAGYDVVLVLDWQGHRSLQAKLTGDVLGVFILPPSVQCLEGRLRARGDNADQVAYRMAEAEEQASHARDFAFRVVNDGLEAAVADIRAILTAARMAREI